MNLSKYQQAIIDYAANDDGSAACISVAGSGKTFTSVQTMKQMDDLWATRAMCFNNTIKDELRKKVPSHVEVMNYNGFGWRTCLRQMETQPKLDKDKTKKLFKHFIKGDEKKMRAARGPIVRFVSLFKNLAIFSADDARKRFLEIKRYYGLETPEFSEFEDWLFQVFNISIQQTSIFDFDDQKYMPIKLGLNIPQCDNLFIDEYQDTCPIESLLLLGGCVKGRKFVFGDPDQCIYSFKGTEPNAIGNFVKNNNAHVFPLSICYRCPTAVIEEAQKFVPRIEAAPGASRGIVDTVRKFKPQVGDMILCRVTADLVSSCLRLLSEGIPAYIVGRQIGEELINFIERFHDDKEIIENYYMKQMERYARDDNEGAAQALQDKVDIINVLYSQCGNMQETKQKIDDLFKEDGYGVAHMTIHKAKGLESAIDKDVYILRPDLLPHPAAKQQWMQDEERRIQYVAVTRARRSLYYVENR